MHFTHKQNPLRYEHLQDVIEEYKPENRRDSVEDLEAALSEFAAIAESLRSQSE